MKLKTAGFEGVYKIQAAAKHTDCRGGLVRIFDAEIFEAQGIHPVWKQQSISLTTRRNTLRGLHVQLPPFTEAKLISRLSGEMFWVVVDLRCRSATFGKWEAVILSEEIQSLYVPRGFAHGCLSLTDDCRLLINSDNFYSAAHGIGIAYNDPELNIRWPKQTGPPLLSAEHLAFPSFETFRVIHGGLQLQEIALADENP